jgi:hypothetical protein
MPFFAVLILWAVFFALSIFLRPKPQISNAKPAGLGDFKFPTATEGRVIPVIWGTVRLDGPNVVWYGDLKVKAITKKVKTGMFSSKKQTIGYQYFIGLQFGLCRGVVDKLKTIWINEKTAFSGSLGGETATTLTDPNMFGGKDQGGGIDGTFRFYVGNSTQAVNSYISGTPPSFLWHDDFTRGGDDESFSKYLGSDAYSYYQVSATGTPGAYGPGSGLQSESTMRTASKYTHGVDGTVKVRSNYEGGAPGDQNLYVGLLVHPNRPRIGDHIKAVMTFIAKDGAALDFGSRELWMGVKCKDFDDRTSQDGVYCVVSNRTSIAILYHSPTSSGMQFQTILSAPTNFADLSSNKHTLELRVSGITITLLLDGVQIYSGTQVKIADIDTENKGFVLGVNGNLNIEFFSANDWSAVGIYSLTLDDLTRVTANSVLIGVTEDTAGTGYVEGDVVTIIGGSANTQATVELTHIATFEDWSDDFSGYTPGDLVGQGEWNTYINSPFSTGTSPIVASGRISNSTTTADASAYDATDYTGFFGQADYTANISVQFTPGAFTWDVADIGWFLEVEDSTTGTDNIFIKIDFLSEEISYRIAHGSTTTVSTPGINDGNIHAVQLVNIGRAATLKLDSVSIASGIALGLWDSAKFGTAVGIRALTTDPLMPADSVRILSSSLHSEDRDTFTIIEPGSYPLTPDNPASVSGGTGTGLTLNAVWQAASHTPAYRGVSYGVWEGGYLGNTTQIQPWAFEIQRCPNGLGLTGNKHIVNGADANPANVLYELMTDPDWGLGFNDGDLDLSNFVDVGSTMYTEGNGWSFVLDNQMECNALLKLIEEQIDGTIFRDRVSGKFKIKLIRADYNIDDIPAADETNVIKREDFTRGTWEGSTNNVRIQFTDRSKNYGQTFALAQDSANIALQGGTVVNVQDTAPGVKDRTLANNIAWRSLRSSAFPLAKVKLTVNRTLHFVNPGDVIKWSDTKLNIVNMPLRISRVDLGKLDDGQIVLDCVQDVFTYDQVPSMSAPFDTYWLDTKHAPVDVPVASRMIFESTKAISDRAEDDPGVSRRIWVGAIYPADRSNRFEVWTEDSTDSGFAHDMDVESYMLAGSLNATLNESNTQGSGTITIVCSPSSQTEMIAGLEDHTQHEIGQGLYNIAKIGDEFIGYESVTAVGDNIVLHNIYRGLMDTTPAIHAASTRVWFLSTGGNITGRTFGTGHTVHLKLLPDGVYGTLAIGLASQSAVTIAGRAFKPYPPTNFSLWDTQWPTTASLDIPDVSTGAGFWSDARVPSGFNNSGNVALGFKFTPTVNGYVHGIQFYKQDATNHGPYHCVLWNSVGTLLADVTLTSSSASGLLTLYFDTPVAVTAASDYVASIYYPTGHWGETSGAYTGTVTSNFITTNNNAGLNGVGDVFPTSADTRDFSTDIVFTPLVTDGILPVKFTRRDFRTADEVASVIDESNLDADFPAANTTEYQLSVYNDPAGTNTLLFTTAFNNGDGTINVSRAEILRHTLGVIPSTLGFKVATHHTNNAIVFVADQTLDWTVSVSSADLTGDTNWGVLAFNTASSTHATATSTGTYSLRIDSALATGAVEIELNGSGTWTSVIAATNTSGTFAVTSGDTIKIRHQQNTTTPTQTICQLLNAAGASVAYAVFTY